VNISQRRKRVQGRYEVSYIIGQPFKRRHIHRLIHFGVEEEVLVEGAIDIALQRVGDIGFTGVEFGVSALANVGSHYTYNDNIIICP